MSFFFLDNSLEKIKEGVFDGPQIKRLLNDEYFLITMNGIEEAALSGIKAVVHGSLGNRRDDVYKELVQNIVKAMKLSVHLDKFPDNLGAYSDEQGERFHQGMKVMEERYQGVWDCQMTANYCWNLSRDLPEYIYKRKSKRIALFREPGPILKTAYLILIEDLGKFTLNETLAYDDF
ncbi:hypothetical protein LAZ67_5001402 [Cordylochernes scorpioides]|uniref:Uncharacterized protein n=1 Tax=Cordylochernes scorpioides TaxID=51811 RepID=A0ABY6KGD1_9ARAC|nr:hypothetical protein LAZ67_5001402 [Cordylochernes scorpioides]